MEVKKDIEKVGKSAVKLTVTVPSEEGEKAYNNLVKKYSKNIEIKGFRKGKVPFNVMEQKFGESLRQETMTSLIDDAFQNVMEKIDDKNQPLAAAKPELDDAPEFKPGEDFSFTVKYDIYPEFELSEYKNIPVKEKQVKISKKDEEAELKKIQEQNSMIMDKENKTVAGKNIITMDYCEVDSDDNEIEDKKRSDFVFTVGEQENYYLLDKEIRGMKVGQEKVIEKEYPEDCPNPDLAGTTKRIKVNIKAVKEKQIPEIDDELAKDVSDDFETLDDLKADIRKNMDDKLREQVKNDNLTQILKHLGEENEIEIPDSLVKSELENRWKNFIQQFGGMTEEQFLPMLEAQGKSKDDLLKEWEPDALENIKNQLILAAIEKNEEITASDEELNEELEKQAENYGKPVEEIKKMFSQNGLIDYIKGGITQKKTMDLVLDNAKKSKGEKISFKDFVNA